MRKRLWSGLLCCTLLLTLLPWAALPARAEATVYSGFTADAGVAYDCPCGNLVDGDVNTKWYASLNEATVPPGENDKCVWVDFHAENAITVNQYSLVTGDDTAEYDWRNPHAWTLQAKRDPNDPWTTIAAVTDDHTLEAKNKETYTFSLAQTGTWQYFRFMAGGGSEFYGFQFQELMLGYAATGNLASATVSGVRDSYSYTGEVIAVAYTVTAADGTVLREGVDYDAAISPSPVLAVGDYTLTLSGKGNYSGTKTVSFSVVGQSYTIAYDLNGGTIPEGANPTSYTGGTESFTLLIPVKSGYTFAGWTGTGLDGATVTVLIPRGSTGSRSYTATWMENMPDDVRVTGIHAEDYNLAALPLGDCWKVTAIIEPENATNPGVLWTSDNPSAVVVDENGLIRAVGIGTATVTATTVDGGHQQTGKITVKNADEVTSGNYAMDRPSARLAVGETLRLYANSSPNAVSVRWESSDTSVLTVDETGLVTSVGPGSGSAYVYAYITPRGLGSEKWVNCFVWVVEATPQSIDLDASYSNMLEVAVRNEDAQLSATLVGAWYDADGRLLGVAVQAITMDKGLMFFDLARPAGTSGAASCRAFLLGADFEPLCLSKSASLQSEPSSE